MKGRYGSDKGSVTHGHTDGRTDIHGGKNNICLPQGETYNYDELYKVVLIPVHIDWIINWLNIFGATIFQNIRKPIEARRGQKGKYQLDYRSLYRTQCSSGQGTNRDNLIKIYFSNQNYHNGLNIASFNARSVKNKTLFLCDFVIENEIDILCITESWLQEQELSIAKEIAPEGFSVKNAPRQNGWSGVILIIYKSNFKIQFQKIQYDKI